MPPLTHDVNGKTVSLHVDPQHFKDSIHGSMFTCVDCHTDVKSAAARNHAAENQLRDLPRR